MNARSCPFIVGSRYLVKEDVVFLNHVLRKGDTLIFAGHGYDAKLGVTRYSFRTPSTGDINSWHVWDNDQITADDWNTYFENT